MPKFGTGRVSLFYENLGELKMRFLWGMSLSQSKNGGL